MEHYSVLMTVYYKENPEYLRLSIQSMLSQTVPPDDFVLSCDGPLTPELDAVIEQFDRENPGLFQIVRLPKNLGVGSAAQSGLGYCKNRLIAKMDSDDISMPERCEKLLQAFQNNPELTIVGCQMTEFIGEAQNIISTRSVPLAHSEILRYARRRSPFNNQTVMLVKQAVQAVGGYSDLKRCEDYDLFVRMLHKGFLSMNLPDALVNYRLSRDAYRRRGAWSNLSGFVAVRYKVYKSGYSRLPDFIIPCIGQLLLSILPGAYREYFYTRMRRQG